MADIIKTLLMLKGKVLDAVNFELLRRAYELQNQNIEQLKNNNEALKESNTLLRDKANRLESENNEFKQNIKNLEKKINSINNNKMSQELSEVAEAILLECKGKDKKEFGAEDMIEILSYRKLEIEGAINELSKLKLISVYETPLMGGIRYDLTPKGTEFVLKIHKG
ncbi:MAG: hypothetical protein Q7J67_09555 [bacterium]|nr:hypothetical protein [bacterium]